MEGIRGYLLSVTAAALLCGILVSLLQHKQNVLLVKLICGIFLTLVLARPLLQLNIEELSLNATLSSDQAEVIAQEGTQQAKEALKSNIIDRTEAYILQKAESYGAFLTVSVTVSEGEMPVPSAVELCGAISPLTKQKLSQWIAEELGIGREAQTWVS